MSLTPEEIEQNWKRFVTLCESTGDRAPALGAMLADVEDRLCLCPASAKLDYHGAFPGGLVDHSLRVLNNLAALNKTYGWKLPKDSMIIAALFHDIGKLGMPGDDAANDFYLTQTDSWRRDKLGEVYRYNNDIPYFSTPDRSMFVMQHYQVKLTPQEWQAIKLNDGFVYEPNKPYCLKIPPLVYGLMTADYVATMQEKPGHVWPVE